MSKKILLIASDRIGDCIFYTPAIALLHKTFPDAHIDIIVTSNVAAQVFANNPHINNIIKSPAESEVHDMTAMYDIAINLYINNKFMLDWLGDSIPKFSDGPADAKHFAEHAIDTICEAFPEIDRTLAGDYELYPQPENITNIEALFDKHNISTKNDVVLVCHMGCSTVAKRCKQVFKRKLLSNRSWPTDRFIKLLKELHKDIPNLKVVLTGVDDERRLVKPVLKKCKKFTIDLLGATSILDTVALLQKANAVLTIDTGTLHMAAAVDAQLVSLYSSSRVPVSSISPYPPKQHFQVLAKPKVEEIKVTEVKTAVLTALEL